MQRALLHNKNMSKAFDSYQIKADEAAGAKITQKNRSSMREILDTSQPHSQDGSFVGHQVEKYSMSSSSLASERDDVVTNMRNLQPMSIGLVGESGPKGQILNDPNSLHTQEFELKESSFEAELAL